MRVTSVIVAAAALLGFAAVPVSGAVSAPIAPVSIPAPIAPVAIPAPIAPVSTQAGAVVASAAARFPGEPIPGCQYRSIPPAPIYWQSSLNFFYSGRYRTSNGTCSRDAIRYYLSYFSNSPFDCARVWIRTFNPDGTTRRVWDSQPICPGQERAFINVDNNRAFRIEIRSDYLQAEHNVPIGSFNF